MLEAAIGLEVHLALATDSKLFCGCPNGGQGLEPNLNTCPVCLGLPGSLPVVNESAVDLATAFALALGCRPGTRGGFDRKHYFYPDAPKNYQISQLDEPIGSGGAVELPDGQVVRIARCHLEEDAGRLVHPAYADHTLVDLNRAGAPLIELVTEPDLRSPEQARDFLVEVQAIARALHVSDATPEEGKMRCDVNVSLRAPGAPLGVKVEVKNLNSFRNVAAALAFEVKRQTQLLEAGRPIVRETRGFSEGGQRTFSLRGKEESADYRYLPDPDLPPVRAPAARAAGLSAAPTELPRERSRRYQAAGVRPSEARQIAYDRDAAAVFDAVSAVFAGPAQVVANWLTGDVAAAVKEPAAGLSWRGVAPSALAELLTLVANGSVTGPVAKEILPEVLGGADPRALVASRGLASVADENALASLVDEVLEREAELVARVKVNPNAVNALLGQVMKASAGRATPAIVRRLLDERLAQRDS